MTHPKLYTPLNTSKMGSLQGPHTLRQVLAKAHTRLFILCCSFILIFLIIAGRLVDVSLFRKGRADGLIYANARETLKFRANIVDRNGELLVTSLKTCSLYANPRVVMHPHEVALNLSKVLPELNYKEILNRLDSQKGFVWLARHLPPQKQAEVMRLGLPGLYLQADERRVYPHGALFSHVIGYTNIDNQGLGGIERAFNSSLLKKEGPLALSLDLRVQHILRDELLEGIERYMAQGGAGMVMNVQTGEILAMVSLPDFDPNQVGKLGPHQESLFNRLTLGTYEMGSSFKIFTTALYLERGGNPSKSFDIRYPLRLGRFRIKDVHPVHYPVTVDKIFMLSSNIGAAKMALEMGSFQQKSFFHTLGFFKAASLEVPELGYPLYPKNWTEATTITASYGYGVAITPLHLVSAIAGIVNKGMMCAPTLLKKKDHPPVGRRVVSEKTSEAMRQLLYLVVAEGTGKKARVLGYQVGGKTGTANTLSGKSYKEGSNMTSFVGIFPMSNPRYLVLIMIDHPKGTKETYGFNGGGWNATPVAGKVIERMAALLQVAPLPELPPFSLENPTLLQVRMAP